MNFNVSLTYPVAPENEMQRCTPMHKGRKLFGSDPVPNDRSFSLLSSQDGAPPLSFNQPIISNFRNNRVR